MASMEECKIEYQENEEKDTYIVSFSNGILKFPAKENVKFQAYENEKTADGLQRRFRRKILVTSMENMDYVGYNYGPLGLKFGNFCKHYVGILNKTTGKMRVLDAEYFHLHPYLAKQSEVDESEDGPNLSTYEKVTKLVTAFGGKKVKRRLEAKAKNKISDAALQNVMSEVAGPVGGGQEVATKVKATVSNTSGQEATIIPPQNKEALTPYDVYKISDIISEKEDVALEAEAAVFKNATREQIMSWTKEKTYPEFVCYCLSVTKPGKLDMQKAKLLVYYTYLMQFSKLKWSDVRKKDPLPNVPNPMKDCIINRFTIMGSQASGRPVRSLPQRMKEKLLVYALVVALFLNKFRIPISKLLVDFSVRLNRLTALAHALGCHVTVSKVENEKIVELKIPLFEMKTNKGPPQRGKR